MTGGLQKASPTFLGATRESLEEHFSFIPNVLVRQEMISNYLHAADRSMVSTLNALNGLYQTELMAAQNTMEAEQKNHQAVANMAKELYSELQWENRLRFQEQMKEGGGGSGEAPDWFVQDIINEYASMGQSPSEDTIRNRWQQELMKKEKEKWMGGDKDTSTLSVLDVDRYNESYPDAKIFPGDTKTEAERKIYNVYVVPEIFKQFKNDGLTKEETEDEWKSDNETDTIPSNVQTIIDEVFKEDEPEEKSTWQSIYDWIVPWR